jgi:hypothetical protein
MLHFEFKLMPWKHHGITFLSGVNQNLSSEEERSQKGAVSQIERVTIHSLSPEREVYLQNNQLSLHLILTARDQKSHIKMWKKLLRGK